MKLYSLLQVFVGDANEQQLIQPLLPSEPFHVILRYEEERYNLHISQYGLSVFKEEPATYTLHIKTERDLHSLFTGEIPLQTLLRRQGIVYEGSLRILLLLESVFFICHNSTNCT
ncbi:hypothetical protein [Ectobacillus polymachus]|uniref:hypothetical protein n=1 Tax=Ectobacillus polymachus TaxID=1508806 RepID=UPI003A8362CA